MKKFLLLALLGIFATAPAGAQQQMQALVVSSCGSASYVAGTYGILTMDTTGKLCGSSSGGGGGSVTQGTSPWVDNITQWASVTLGAATAWGTAPTGNVPGVNANILGPLGQQLSAASIPVVLPAAQITTLTPPAAITGFATQTTLAAILTAQGAAPAQQTGAVVGQVSQYPAGATAITASATGTTGATSSDARPARPAKNHLHLRGYSIRANAATAAATVTDTITGTITGTLREFHLVEWRRSRRGLGVDEQIFSPCIPASATNTGIAIVSGAPGTGGNVSSKGWGYQL